MTNKEYHEHPSISRSKIVKALVSPAHAQVKEEETEAMKIGTAVHAYTIEGLKLWVESPFDSFRTKEAKEWRDSQELPIFKKADVEMIENVRNAVVSGSLSGELFSGGEFEQSFFFTEPNTGVPCKIRTDYLKDFGGGIFENESGSKTKEGLYIIDLKTTEDASEKGFRRSVYKYRLDIQASFYLDGYEHATGVRPEKFIFVNVEKKAPFGVSIFELEDHYLEEARLDYLDGLEAIKKSIKNKKWECFPQKIQKLS